MQTLWRLGLSPVIFLGVTAFTLVGACKKQEQFPDLGNRVANPVDVAVDASERYFYALNSDYPREYNQGSLLILDTSGKKINVLQLPRLGRSLTVAGNALIVTLSNSGESPAQILLFDISSPDTPTLAKTFEPTGCNPLNATARASYGYWAVSCSNGPIFAGNLTSPLGNSTLQKIRNFRMSRRALHLDTTRNLLLAFPTDIGEQEFSDIQADDSKSVDDSTDAEVNEPNEIPDQYERSRFERSKKSRNEIHQFAVINLSESANLGWPEKDQTQSLQDLRWIYFNLANTDGSLDMPVTETNQNTKYYRTNFWEAKPDLSDANIFYLSHRGTLDSTRSTSPHANNIIKIQITGDITDKTQKTKDVMTFERIYGFKTELEKSDRHFLGDFEVASIQGQSVLLVNHFRDLVNWPGQGYFSIATKIIGNNSWFAEASTSFSGKSYYQVALTSSGRALAANFYGNTLILLDVVPGVGITEQETNIQ
jgi:hypothetical protein